MTPEATAEEQIIHLQSENGAEGYPLTHEGRNRAHLDANQYPSQQ